MARASTNFYMTMTTTMSVDDVAQAIVARVKHLPLHTIEPVGVGNLVIKHRYLPRWATVFGVVANALFFFVRDTETAVANITRLDARDATQINISGTGTPELQWNLADLLIEMPTLAEQDISH